MIAGFLEVHIDLWNVADPQDAVVLEPATEREPMGGIEAAFFVKGVADALQDASGRLRPS